MMIYILLGISLVSLPVEFSSMCSSPETLRSVKRKVECRLYCLLILPIISHSPYPHMYTWHVATTGTSKIVYLKFWHFVFHRCFLH